MEENKLAIAALLFILLIIGSNFVMYAIARGYSSWISTLRGSFRKPTDSTSNKSMDELRKQIEALENKKKKE